MASRAITSKVTEARALYFAFIATLLTTVLSGIAFYGTVVPFLGSPSIGTVSALFGALSALVAFFVCSYMNQYAGTTSSARRAFSHMAKDALLTGSLAFVHAAILFLLTTGMFYLMSLAFVGLSLDWVTASVMTGLTVGVGSYIVYLSAATMNTVRLSGVLAVFVLSGGLTSMITSENEQWWELHFSTLGGSDSFSSVAFNLTLVIAGLVIVTLADYISIDFGKLKQHKKEYRAVNAQVIRWSLVMIGVFLACVGIFQYDTRTFIHNTTAGGMAIVFVGLVLFLPKIAPVFSRAFFIFSYALMASLVFCYWLMNGSLGYLNLTAFELIAAGIIFGWLVVFIRQIAASLEDQSRA